MKRLYVGGLSHSITQKDLKDRFGKFGEVEDVEVRTRRDDDGVPYKTFSYININISDGDLKRCMTVLNKSKWKGGTLEIETARESFLHRLAQEREELLEQQQSPAVDQKEKVLESLRKAGVENFHMKSAVPGTEVPGHKDWVVSKFGRVLPVLHLKCRNKTVTMDPSKHSHNIKKLDPPSPTRPTPVSKLTWEIQGGDDDISKKRRGEFPPHKPTRPKRTRTDAPQVAFQTDAAVRPRVSDDHEGTNGSMDQTPPVASISRPRLQTPFPEDARSNRTRLFDVDSDEDIQRLVAQQSSQGALGQDTEEDFLEVVGDDYLVKPGWGWDQKKGERDGEDYDSADTDEILTSRKTPSNQQEAPTEDDKPEKDTAKRKQVKKTKKKKTTAGKEEEHNDSADTDEILTSTRRPKTGEKVVSVAKPPSSEPAMTKKKKKVSKKVVPVAKPPSSESDSDDGDDDEAVNAVKGENKPKKKPPSSEPDVTKKKKKVMKKVIPVAKPPLSDSDSDDDDDDDDEESNNGRLSVSEAVKGENKPKKTPDSSESDVTRKKKVPKKVIPVAKPPSSEPDSDDDNDGDDDEEEESNDVSLSVSEAVKAVKGENKQKKKPPSSEPDVTKKKKKVTKKVVPVAKPPSSESDSDDDDDDGDDDEEEESNNGSLSVSEAVKAVKGENKPKKKPPSSEPDVTKKKKKVVPVAKPPSSESDSDDDDDDDDVDDEEEESNHGSLSDSVTAVKGGNKPKKTADSSESDDSGGDSDYEAMFSNCVRLEISFSDLQQLASFSSASHPDSDTEPGPSQTSSKTTLPSIPSATKLPETSIPTTGNPATKVPTASNVPEKVPKKGTTPEEILACIMADDSSDDEKKMKKKKKNKSVVSLPAFQGTKGLMEAMEGEGESLKKRPKDAEGEMASKRRKLNTQPSQPVHTDQTKPAAQKDTRKPVESSSKTSGSSSESSEEEAEACEPLRTVTAAPATASSSSDVTSSEEEMQATVSASKVPVKVPAKQLPKAVEPEAESSSSSSSSEEEEEAKSSRPVSLKVGTKQPPKAVKPKAGSSSSSSSSEDDEDEGEKEVHRTQTVTITKAATVDVLAKKTLKAATAKTVPETDSSSSESSSSEEEEGSKMSKPTQQRPETTIRPPSASRGGVDEERQKQDNLRRLAAMEQRLKETEQNKKLIQGALANVDAPAAGKGKHVVFGSDNDDDDDDDDEEGSEVETPKKTLCFQSDNEDSEEAGPANKKAVKEKSSGSKLFDSEGEDDEEEEEDGSRFQIKQQFEGKAGQKLMALQSRFGTDQRFQMDSRFMEGDEHEEEEEEGPGKPECVKEGGEEELLEEEKRKNLSILGSVLNINIQPANKTASKSKTFRDVSALHYDPTREEHAAFETKPDDSKRESKASRKKKREESEKVPEVSKEIYYDVSVDLKEVFGGEKEKTPEADPEGEEKIGWDKEEKEEKEDEEEDEEEEEEETDQALLTSLLSDPGAGKEKEDAASGFKFSFFGDDLDANKEETEYRVELIHGPKVSWQLDPRLRDSSSGEDEEEDEEEVEKEKKKKEEQTSTAKTTEVPAQPK